MTLIYPDHPNRAGILDAARRAAGVEDSRLVRILDVGSQSGGSFIVEEAMTGAESLAELLLQGALPAEEARRIAGETATALEAAGQRGLHHLRLTPHCVLRSPDGMIKVSGVAVAAAIDGPDEQEPDPAAASRRDSVCVVAITYAALTTRWPLDEQVPGLEPAPRVVGGVAAPSEIAAGVPGDLDALCRMTLNEDAGPMEPGDFASQIAPWSRGPVRRPEVEPTVVMQLPTASPPAVTPRAPVSANGAERTVLISRDDLSTDGAPADEPSMRSADAVPGADNSATVANPTVADRTVAASAAASKAVGAAVGTALANAGTVAGAVGGKVGTFARAAADKAAAATDKAARSQGDAGGERMTLREAFFAQSDEAEPPLPMLPASTAQAPSGQQSKVVVMIVAAFVALSLLVAYCGVQGMGISLPRTAPRRTVAGQTPPVTTPAPPATQAGPVGPAPGLPIAILSARGFDPLGDGREKNSQAARVYDGDTATSWTSEGYNTSSFGGLKKGVGVRLDLGQPTSVSRVTLDLGVGPADVTAYAATKAGLEGATVIGEAKDASGRVELTADRPTPQAQYLIVWFTRLAPDGGQFRASLAEVALS